MIKIFLSLVFCTTVCKAQFVGSYNLRNGGVDAMSSELSVLPDNEFAIATHSAVIFGKWKEIGKNRIVLTDERSEDAFFKIYAGTSSIPGQLMKFSFTNFDEAGALISLSNDTLQQTIFRPVFDNSSFYGDYSVYQPVNTVKFIKLAFRPPADNEVSVPPDKFYVYTFALPEKFNSWYIVFDTNRLNAIKSLELEKKADVYLLNDKKIGNREELTEKDIQDIKLYKSRMEKPVSKLKNNRYRDIPEDTEKIPAVHVEIIELENNLEKALFPPKQK